MHLNVVNLVGRLTRNPELQFVGENKLPVCRFTIAVNQPYFNRNSNEWNERTDYPDVEVWGEAAERVVKTFSKGDLVIIEGKIRTDSWEDKDGNKHKRTYVRIEKIRHAVPKKKENGQETIEEVDDIEF